MKNIRILPIALMFCAILSITTVFADTPPPPPPGGGHGSGGNQPPGGGAPIGEALLILTMLGAGYGAKKLHGKNR